MYTSLFSEFKNNEGYLSTIYYSIFFLRRLSYLLSQVYLNSYLFLQSGINIGFSAIQTIHLLYYKPFKELELLISSIVGEIVCLTVICLSTIFIQDVSTEESYIFETIIVYAILGGIGVQLIISLYSIFKSLKKLFQKILKFRNLDFVRSFNRRVEIEFTEANVPNKIFNTNPPIKIPKH
jgi:hypothetical protein